ncbi:CD226 antigen [Labeo rohita]|uniref:CD226 antigen n=1 Tax=Labeo rohita TaxID=84645 RepID=A0ABQ8MD22_LABRO|nr:CD226 antigen [Labeo rohita]
MRVVNIYPPAMPLSSEKLNMKQRHLVDGSAVAQMKKTGFIGQDVLLSCNCSNDLNELVWQKDETIVNFHLTDKSLINDSYKNRTQLFLNNEKRNCSLLIRNISSEDAGVYICHALASLRTGVWSRKTSEVFLTVVDGSAVAQMKKTGFTGQDVLLSCNCSNEHDELVWQKDERIVNAHSEDKTNIDDSYKDRTQLFLNNEKRNCSLLIRNISSEDAGVYTCHALVKDQKKMWARKSSEVILTVLNSDVWQRTFVYLCSPDRTVSEPLGVTTTHLPEVDQGVHRLRICSRSDTRGQTMKILTFLTLLLITSSSAVGQTVQSNQTGFVGQDVLLPCNCSDDLNELVWQKDETIVNLHPTDKSLINDSYKDRTQLFLNNEKRNCSLLIRNISSEDAGVYTCHDLARVQNMWLRKSSNVILTGELSNSEFSRSIVSILKGNSKPLPVVHFQCASLFKNTGSEEPMLEKV